MVVYASVDQVYAEPVLKDFGRSTGVRVLPVFDVEAAKTTGLVNRLIAERARPVADVFWNGEFVQTLRLKRQGVLAPYASPSASGLPPGLADAEHYWAASGARCRVLLVNGRTPPRAAGRPSLDLLLDPRIPPHRAGIAYPMFGTTATHAAALYAIRGARQGRAYFEKLRARGVRVVDGNSVVRDLVAGGELDIGLTDSDDACGALARKAAVRVELPDQDGEGTLVIPGTVALVARGPNPAEGRRLADYLLSADVEKRLIDAGFYQLSVRELSKPAGCLAGRRLKALPLAPEQVFDHFDSSRADMESIFVR